MSQFTISIHAQLVRQGLEALDEEIPKVGRQRVYLRMLRIKSRMSADAPKVRHPIDWDTPKQKKAYFASDGFGEGIPYRRKGETQRSWVLTSLENGYRLANRKGFFVYGDLSNRKTQSNIHKGTWPLTKTVAFEELDQLPEEIFVDIDRAKKRAGL